MMEPIYEETLRRLFTALDENQEQERILEVVREERDSALYRLEHSASIADAKNIDREDRYVNGIRVTAEMSDMINHWRFAVEYLFNTFPDNISTPGLSGPGSMTSVKIKLIKCVRKAWDYGLKDSKDIVEMVTGL